MWTIWKLDLWWLPGKMAYRRNYRFVYGIWLLQGGWL